MEKVLGTDTVVNQAGETVQVSSFCGEGKYVGIYFSAHWCPPCRSFTPKLAEFYNAAKAANKNLEIIFVSFDRDEESFKAYFDTMPWLSIKYESSDVREALGKDQGVSGIPAFMLFNGSDGTVIDKNARGKVESDMEATQFPNW